MKRMTAVKVRVKDIIDGQWVKNEGMVPSYIITPYGEHVSRTRIMGTVVSRFISEDKNFASVTVDDSTDTIRLKTFKTSKPLDILGIGDVVDIIGKIREYNGELYIIPEIAKKISNVDWEILRKIEVLSKIKKYGIKGETKGNTNIKGDILNLINSRKDGIGFTEIIKAIKAEESSIESAINNLLSEGVCYESRPGIIKKI